MKNERLTIKTITSYEVATSADGLPGTWHRNSSYKDTPEEKQKAEAAFRTLLKSSRFVRLAHITKKIKPVKVIENTAILLKSQIEKLVTAGKTAIGAIPGVMVNESASIGFGAHNIVMSPSRVTVSFSASSVLGKRPTGPSTPPNARAEWDEKSKALTRETLEECHQKLIDAGIKHTYREGQEIELHP